MPDVRLMSMPDVRLMPMPDVRLMPAFSLAIIVGLCKALYTKEKCMKWIAVLVFDCANIILAMAFSTKKT